MKRVGNIYGNVCDLDNIKLAIINSSLGKRKQKRVKEILDNMDFYAKEIQNILTNKLYIPSPYTIKTIQDGSSGKIRTIYKPKYYPDIS